MFSTRSQLSNVNQRLFGSLADVEKLMLSDNIGNNNNIIEHKLCTDVQIIRPDGHDEKLSICANECVQMIYLINFPKAQSYNLIINGHNLKSSSLGNENIPCINLKDDDKQSLLSSFKAVINSDNDNAGVPLNSYMNFGRIDMINITFDKSTMIKTSNEKSYDFPQDTYDILLKCVLLGKTYDRHLTIRPNQTYTLNGNHQCQSMSLVMIDQPIDEKCCANIIIDGTKYSQYLCNQQETTFLFPSSIADENDNKNKNDELLDQHRSQKLPLLSQSELNSVINLSKVNKFKIEFYSKPKSSFMIIMKSYHYFYGNKDITDELQQMND